MTDNEKTVHTHTLERFEEEVEEESERELQKLLSEQRAAKNKPRKEDLHKLAQAGKQLGKIRKTRRYKRRSR